MRLTLLFSLILCASVVQAQEWEERAEMPRGKHHPVTFSLDGKGYAISGSATGQIATRDVYQYDPVEDSWEEMDVFPGAARSYSIGQAYNGKGYMGFGSSTTSYLSDVWEYDPATDDWDLLTVCPCSGRRHPAFLIANDMIFVGLGDGSSGNFNDWWIYDMTADQWTQQPNIPGPNRHHPFMFVANNEIYAGMGHGSFVIYDDWYRFDQTSFTWETMDDFPGEARVAGTQFSHDNVGYVLSGDGNDHSWMATGEFWKYQDSSDTWEQLTSHPGISRWAPGSFVIEDSVYFLAGQNRQTDVIQEDVWTFQLKEDPVDTVPPAGVSHLKSSGIILYPNPTSTYLNVKSNRTIDRIEVFDLQGRKVWQQSGETRLDVRSLEKGSYVVRLTLAGDSEVLRFIKEG